MFKGLRPVLEGFVVPLHEGACETESQLTYCPHKPECIGTTNPDSSVLITIITWHFQFYIVNASKKRVCARSESRFTRPSDCYFTGCPLTTGIDASQYPSSWDVVLVRRCLALLIPVCLNTVKATLPRWNIFTTNLRIWMKVMTLHLTAIIGGIFHKQCQWLAWRVLWHALAFVTYEITWRRVYVA